MNSLTACLRKYNITIAERECRVRQILSNRSKPMKAWGLLYGIY